MPSKLISIELVVLLGFAALCFGPALVTAQDRAMYITLRTLASDTTVCVPLTGTVSLSVTWGDGSSSETYTSISACGVSTAAGIIHTYASAGNYTVRLDRYGSGPVWLQNFGAGLSVSGRSFWTNSSVSSKFQLTRVHTFGDLGMQSLNYSFCGCLDLVEIPSVLPPTITILDATFTGFGASNRGVNLGNVSLWNTSEVTVMSATFSHNINFSQPLNSWDVSKVTTMRGMFQGATSFNQPLNNWNTGSVTNMEQVFQDTMFNQPIDAWDVSSVTSMGLMFGSASAFNQPLNSWNVGSVTEFYGMFRKAAAFNGQISSWDVSAAKGMKLMFQQSAFNRPINSWNVSGVKTFDSMFLGAESFNQPLDQWKIFANTQPEVDGLGRMFYHASRFNQNLTSWCVSQFSSEPLGFSADSALISANQPRWNTSCSYPTAPISPQPPVASSTPMGAPISPKVPAQPPAGSPGAVPAPLAPPLAANAPSGVPKAVPTPTTTPKTSPTKISPEGEGGRVGAAAADASSRSNFAATIAGLGAVLALT